MASLASNSQVSWFLRDREGSPFKQIRSFYVINLLSKFYDGPSYQITAGDTGMFDGCSRCLKIDFGFLDARYNMVRLQLISVRWWYPYSRVEIKPGRDGHEVTCV